MLSLGALLAAPVACTRKPDNSALDSNVSSIDVSLDATKVLVGFTTQANASLKDAVGNPINSSVGWYSSNPKVANVDP
ncbi:MAG TPA: Ig-like domain-containing protein, partial [Gemmatimonadaceae bacterium]